MFMDYNGVTYQKDDDQKRCVIITVSSNEKKITIPAVVNGYVVTGIYNLAFSFIGTVEEIIIPSTISTIGEHAFMACSNLTSIKMMKPNHVVPIKNSKVLKIGIGAFFGCSSLMSVEFFNKELELADEVFNQCFNLSILTGAIKATENNSFRSCYKLESITFANNVNLIFLDLSTLWDLKHLHFVKDARLAERVTLQIVENEITIHCPKFSNLAELIHLGCMVETH